jgi:arylsulfatase A-like enzyme
MSGATFSWEYQMKKVEIIDKQIGRLFRFLKREDWLGSSMIVITADHGDSFGEHGESGHREYLYDSTLRVPLIIKFAEEFPDWLEGTTVDTQVRLTDIAPTILDALGLLPEVDPRDDLFDGASLIDVCVSDDTSDLLAYSETCHEVSPEDWNLLKTHFLGLRDGRWKYIYDKLTGDEQLYDLESDPSEMGNLASRKPKVISRFRSQLFELISAHSVEREPDAGMSDLDMERIVERLRGLGYLD